MAIIYAIIALVVNTISVFSVKELSPEELSEGTTASIEDKVPFIESVKLLAMRRGRFRLVWLTDGLGRRPAPSGLHTGG